MNDPMILTLKAALREEFRQGKTSDAHCDLANGVLFGARILGPVSPNGGTDPRHQGRDYRLAIQNPRSLRAYEGAPYILEHTTADGKILVGQTLGEIRNVRVRVDESGEPWLVGDIHLDSEDQAARKVLRMAERFPHLLSNSHELAEARYRLRPSADGAPPVLEFLEIETITAVACVTRGGTMRGFFEQEEDPADLPTEVTGEPEPLTPEPAALTVPLTELIGHSPVLRVLESSPALGVLREIPEPLRPRLLRLLEDCYRLGQSVRFQSPLLHERAPAEDAVEDLMRKQWRA